MKKIALLFVMVFAFGLTQANNHAAVNIANNDAVLQTATMAAQGVNMQTTPLLQMASATEAGIFHLGNHAKKTKQPKADKKTKANKTRHHKMHHNKKAAHPHHKKTTKKQK